MRLYSTLLPIFFLLSSFTVYAQTKPFVSVTLGEKAPPLLLKEWLKGKPFKKFEKGTVYVVEFWAKWCAPCKAAMPHLSFLANKYKDKIIVLGVDILERKTTSIKTIQKFVDSMGNKMDYYVAKEDRNLMETVWLLASEERKQGIPRSFVVDAEGKLAWIGHPKDIDTVLYKIVNNTWNIKEALNKRNFDKYISNLDDSLRYELMKYDGNELDINDLGKPDSVIFTINKMLKIEPKLKYSYFTANNMFNALLKTDQQKAYEYAKNAILTTAYKIDNLDWIIGPIELNSKKIKLLPKIYELGAEAYQIEINQIPYPELVNMARKYNKMADWYLLAGDKLKASAAQQKATEILEKENR